MNLLSLAPFFLILSFILSVSLLGVVFLILYLYSLREKHYVMFVNPVNKKMWIKKAKVKLTPQGMVVNSKNFETLITNKAYMPYRIKNKNYIVYDVVNNSVLDLDGSKYRDVLNENEYQPIIATTLEYSQSLRVSQLEKRYKTMMLMMFIVIIMLVVVIGYAVYQYSVIASQPGPPLTPMPS